MKVLGIGNAIIDVICKVDDNFIKKSNIPSDWERNRESIEDKLRKFFYNDGGIKWNKFLEEINVKIDFEKLINVNQ